MSDLVRVSLSLEKPLMDKFEELVGRSGYTNRSEFVRDMIRRELVERDWQADREALGTLTLLYNHHQRGLSDKLTELQHRHHRQVLVTSHLHLDDTLCAEVIVIRGRASRIAALADDLRQQKGVLHAALSISTTGRRLPAGRHSHSHGSDDHAHS